MTSANREWARAYYHEHLRTKRMHPTEQRVVPPENVERREFNAPCFRCEARGECEHRRSFMAAS